MTKKRISWITPDCYIDVDLPIINKLCMYYDINWQIVIASKTKVDDEKYVKNGIEYPDRLIIKFIYLKHRSRSLKLLSTYIGIILTAKDFIPDLYYISFNALPYGIPLYKLLLPNNRVVIACHNVTTPKGANNEKIQRLYTKWWLNSFCNIQVFSKSQHDELLKRYNKKNVLVAPLALKDYGEPTRTYNKKELDTIRFLFFGNVLPYKRVDILIEAAQILYEKGVNNFKIRIAGNCGCWDDYQRLIKYPELFETKIERIPNENVADLFADSHYFVMPYQDIAQSGAITVAFRYNVPTIVSDIPQFGEFVTDKVTGYVFKTESAEALAEIMRTLINDMDNYPKVCSNQADFTSRELSIDSITQKYIKFFDNI